MSRSRASMAPVLAALTAAASIIGLVSLLPHQVAIPDRTFQLVLTLSGLPSAAVLAWLGYHFRDALPTGLVHGWLAAAVVMMCLGSWSARTGPMAIASLAFFVWIGLFVGYFFPLRQVLYHLSWIAVSLSVLLFVNGDRATASVGIMIFGIVAAATGASYYLSDLLHRAAVTDGLTGLPNRQALIGLIDREIVAATDAEAPLALGLIDVDHFKAINDRDGHLAGDDVLVSFVAHLRARLRKTDRVIRYGGDEFVVVLPQSNLSDARAILDDLRSTSDIPTSIGLTGFSSGDDATDLLARADQALYSAKAAGRNQIALAGD